MDALMDGGEATSLASRIRAGELGVNPFIGIIITLWQPSEAVIRRIVNCGTEDIIVEPLSPKQIMDRVNVVAFNRKPFVVTSEYNGPDRRSGRKLKEGEEADPSHDVPRIEVPNTLGAKASGESVNFVGLREMVSNKMYEINDQRLKRHSYRIVAIVDHKGLSEKPRDTDNPKGSRSSIRKFEGNL